MEKSNKEAYVDTLQTGRQLVELADEVIADRMVSRAPSMLLHEVLARADIAEALIVPGRRHVLSAAEIFDAFVYPGREAVRNYLEQVLEVVALPHSRLVSELHPGDLVVRRAERGLGHLAMLATGEALRQEEMVIQGIRPESTRSGYYAEVIEGGFFPHDSDDRFARRLSDDNGWLSYDSLILRVLEDHVSAESEIGISKYDLRYEPGMYEDQPVSAPKCGFHGPNGAFVTEADLRKAVVEAALNERKIWWAGNTAEKEDQDARFGDLVRYALAGQSSKIPPGKLEPLQQAAAAGGGSVFSNLGNVQGYRAESAKFDAKTADVYSKSDLVDSLQPMVTAAETRFKAADNRFKDAETKVSQATADLKNAGSQSRSGAQAALHAAERARSEAKAERDTAQKDLAKAKQALAQAEVDLAKAVKTYEDAEKAFNDLEDPVKKWPDADIKKTHKAILAKAGIKDPKDLDVHIQAALKFAYQSRADSAAWSAVFVVACVRAAAIGLKLEAIDSSGAHSGEDGLLMASQKHAIYVAAARERRPADKGKYHAFEPTERAVQVGDLICTDRKPHIEGKPALLKDVKKGMILHVDIVTLVETKNGKPVYAETIGGNVGHTVRRRRYPLDDQGKLIVSATVSYAAEDDQGAFPSLTPRTQVPTMLPPDSTRRIIALLSPVAECKPASGSAPAGKGAKEADTDFEPWMLEEQAANVVDADAAEPIFTGPVRQPGTPLPDLVTLNKAVEWNQKMHPKESGISLAELRARLEQYIDRRALDDLVGQANVGVPTPPYGSDEATIVTLLAHQFQQKTGRMPTVGEIWKPPTMDGRVAEDTLDALGFVYHLGKKTDLNLADQVNTTAAETLKKVKAIEFNGLEPGLTATTWWTYMVRPPWLGMPIKHGIHLVLLKHLRQAQRFLIGLRAYENMSPAELGQVLGLEEEHKGARPTKATKSMHTFGLGIDINITHNPWLSDPENDTSKIAGITQRAAQWVGGKPGNQKGITSKLLHQIAVDNQDTAKIYKILSEWSNWLGSYFALANDPKRVESMLPILNATNPDIGFIRAGESSADAARRWIGIIKTDLVEFANAVDRKGNLEAIRSGFMNLPRDLVLALREYACLAWGAVDFGPSESGDIMHFDCRVAGIGRAIRIATGKPAPTEGHRCIPIEVHRATPREFEEGVPIWSFPFDVDKQIISKYKDENGVLRATNCWVHVPSAAQNKGTIDLLVFFHGLDTCSPSHNFNSKNVVKNFRLDTQVDNSKQEVVLAVPAIYWVARKRDQQTKVVTNQKEVDENKEAIKNNWTAAALNKFVEEVLKQIKAHAGNGTTPTIRNLILVGHSRAYDILTPLANEFVKGASATTNVALPLAHLKQVLAMDTAYGSSNAQSLLTWARNSKAEFYAVFSTCLLDPKAKLDCPRLDPSDLPIKHWSCLTNGKMDVPGVPNLHITLDPDKKSDCHCRLPITYIEKLLSGKLP